MDKFVIKKGFFFQALPGRESLSITLYKILKDTGRVCVYGEAGVGKSTLVNHVCKYFHCNHVEVDNFKNINDVDFFFSESQGTIVIDDFDSSNQIHKHFLELFSENSTKKGVIVCNSISSVDTFDCIEVLPLADTFIRTLAPRFTPYETVERAIRMANGNIHNFNFYIQTSDSKDIFINSKNIMKKLLDSSDNLETVVKNINDFGYTTSSVHENFVDQVTDVDTMSFISDCISLADCYDKTVYKGNWDFVKYYIQEGIANPCKHIPRAHNGNLRSGSSWTKYNNYKMRQSKLKDIRVHRDKFKLLLHYGVEYLKEYEITPQDIDVMNHLVFTDKLKPKQVTRLKGSLKHAYL